MEIAVVAGFAAFLGKYLEQQFNLTTSSANQLLGRQQPTTKLSCFSGKLEVMAQLIKKNEFNFIFIALSHIHSRLRALEQING